MMSSMGFVPMDNLVGKVTRIFWSLDDTASHTWSGWEGVVRPTVIPAARARPDDGRRNKNPGIAAGVSHFVVCRGGWT